MLRKIPQMLATLVALLFVFAAGSNDAVAGKQKTFFPTIAECVGVYDCGALLKIKPRSVKIYSSCGLQNLRWRSWGHKRTNARGNLRCREWGEDSVTVDVRGHIYLSRRTRCKKRYVYLGFRIVGAGETVAGRNKCSQL
jgi:hypothetical protein